MSNMIILIFIIVLLLALYIFTNNPTPPVIVNNTSTIIRDTFKGNKPNNVSKNNSTNNTNTNNNSANTNNTNNTNSTNNNNNNSTNNNSTNGSIMNGKVKIKNRNNSLLQQFIKDDTSTGTKKKEQNAKEFQKMLKDDLEKNVAGVYDTLKNISAPVIPNRIVTDDKYKGYNNYVSLRTDSYAPVTSIGKQLITPFVSYPVAC